MLAYFSAYTWDYSSATLCSWVVARFSSSWYLLTMANMLVSVSHKRWDKFLLDLEQAANSSFKTMLCARDWSLSSLRSLSSLLLPHKAPRNLSRPCSSLRVLLVSFDIYINAKMEAIIMKPLMSTKVVASFHDHNTKIKYSSIFIENIKKISIFFCFAYLYFSCEQSSTIK